VAEVILPHRLPSPLRAIWARVALALGAILFVATITYLDRGGFTDSQGQEIGLLEAFYYSTVSVTTTGYGDIVPSTDRARLITTLLVTPARILFLIVLVGTTVELLFSKQREQFRIKAWRRKLTGQTVICGFGVKGRAALEALVGQGVDRSDVVAIDSDGDSVASASAAGIVAVHGDASRSEILEQARVADAETIIVCPHRDDAAVLMTLTARQLNPRATIVASVREAENADLVKQSGASSVIVSSGAAGRLLGLAARRPATVTVLEDLLLVGHGLDLAERLVGADEAGPRSAIDESRPMLGLMRGGKLLSFDDPETETLRAGDRLVIAESKSGPEQD
jgi:voltage-gated potassium channel